MIIKVCGMRDPENIREVAALGVDWIGLIFFARSSRSIKKINKVTVKAPVKAGDVIVENILGTGVDVIASRSMGRIKN